MNMRRMVVSVGAGMFVLGLCATATAANATWNGMTDGTWATDANWSALAPVTGNTATFNNAGNGNTTLDLGGGVTVKTVLFDTVNAASYTIGTGGAGSQTLTLNDTGAITVNSTVTNDQTVSANLTLGTATASSYTLTSSRAGRTLTLAGKVQGGTGGTAAAKTLAIAGAGNTTISGVVTNGGASSLVLSKTGSGTLILSNVNTYTGSTTAGGGVLRADYGTGLPSATGVLYLNGSGVLETSGTITRNLGTGAGNIAFSGSGGFAARGGALGVTLNSGADLVVGSTGSFIPAYVKGSVVLGSASGDSVVTLNNSLNYTGNPGNEWAGLNVIHNTAIPLTQDKAVVNGALKFNGGNSGSNNGWQKHGNGRAEITGVGASASVNVLISGGVLALTGSGSLSTYRGVWVGGGDFEITGGVADTAKSIAILGISNGADLPGNVITAYGGPGIVTVAPGVGVGARLTAASASRAAGGTALFRGTSLGTAAYPSSNVANLSLTATAGLNLTGGGGAAGSTTISIVPYAVGDSSATGYGTDFVTHTANGIRLLNAGAGEYQSAITDGQTALDNVSVASAQTLSAPTTINALRLVSGGGVTGSGSLTVNSGAVLALAGNSGLSIATLAYGAKEAIFMTPLDTSSPVNLSISGAITGSGGLTWSGSGTLTLSGANAITGTTTVNSGKVVAGAANVLSSGALQMQPGSTIDAAGYNQIFGAATGAGVLTNSGAAVTLTINTSTDATLGPAIAGNLNLLKSGAGTFIVGTGTKLVYSGNTQIDAGALRLDHNSVDTGISTYSLPGTVTLNGGTLRFNHTGAGHYNPTFTFTSPITVTASGGTLDFTGPANGFTLSMPALNLGGDLTVKGVTGNSGVLYNLNGAISLASSVAITNATGATYAHTVSLNPAISGATRTLTLAKSGTGTGFNITGATATSLDLGGLVVAAGTSLDLVNGGVTAIDPLGKIVANGGITTVYGTLSIGAYGFNRTLNPSYISFQPGSRLNLMPIGGGWNSTWNLTASLSVSSSGLSHLFYQPYRGYDGSLVTGANNITVSNGGIFTTSVTEANTVNTASANIRVYDGGILQGTGTQYGGLVRGSAGTLTLGDGTGTPTAPSVVTVRGDYGANVNTFALGFAANTTVNGTVKVKYANTVTGAANYFNVGWSNGGNTLAALLAFKEISGGTEFAPLAGSGGVAVVGPSGTATVATFANGVTHTTAGTVGFYNAGASNVRGALGAVEFGATSALTFQTNGTLRASSATFKTGSTLGVKLTGTASTACSLVDATGTLTFESGVAIAISEVPGLPVKSGPWYVAQGASRVGLPTKSGGAFSVTADGNRIMITRLAGGTVFVLR